MSSPSTTPSNKNLRKAQVVCGCKGVQFHVSEKPDTYNKIEQLSVYCHCTDCTGFPAICLEAAATKHSDDKANNKAIDVVNHKLEATNHIFFFKKNVKLVKGEEHIGWHRLSEKSGVQRFYCKHCGTPMGATVGGMASATFFYGPLIQSLDENDKDRTESGLKIVSKFPDPYYAFLHSFPEKKERHDTTKIRTFAGLPLVPMFHFMGRGMLGYFKGLNRGSFDAPEDDKMYSVGREPETVKLS